MSSSVSLVNNLNDIPPSSSIVDNSVCAPFDVGFEEAGDIPGVDRLLTYVEQGKVTLSDEVTGQLLNLNLKMDAITEESAIIREKWDLLDDKMICHREELDKLKKEHDELKQYIKQDNLLLHGFYLPPYELSSLRFSHFIAQQINQYLPMLDVPVKWEHISDAHPLRTHNKRSNVIIIRFCNRNIRHEIYANRKFLPNGMSITEHLTDETREILDRARDVFGSSAVSTDRCKVFVEMNGRFRQMKSVIDVDEALESKILYPSLSATNTQQHTSHLKRLNTDRNSASAVRTYQKGNRKFNNHRQSSSTTNSRTRQFYNGRYQRHDKQVVKRSHYFPKPSYSVYNRNYCH